MEQFEKFGREDLKHLWDIQESPALFHYITKILNPPLFPTFSSVASSRPSAPQKGGGDEEETEGQEFSDLIESRYGLYPSLDDPRFHEKLFRKLEFSENRQESMKALQKKGIDLCDPSNEFELSPVQRFVSRFLSAQSPYNSALLYHGVGVGKTCAAISIAESYLNIYPNKKVIIVAPPNIQPNFRRTIFDIDNLIMSEDENTPNIQKGCTGNFYLKRTGTEFEREKGVIASRIRAFINTRYEFMGYIQFARYIETIRKRAPDDRIPAEIRRAFEGHMVIIDEAHNLRDIPGETADDNVDIAGGDEELDDASAGKRLTPSLLEVLKVVRGMKLVLLTATPMYNSYREIIFILNLLLINDKRIRIKERDIFEVNGAFKPNGKEILGHAAAAYVSFMRGENPLSFPIRLQPFETPKLEAWPNFSPTGIEISERQKNHMVRLPLVPVSFNDESLETYMRISEESVRRGGVAVASIDTMVQTGNWLFPGTDDAARKGDVGFDGCFEEHSLGVATQFSSRIGPPTWLTAEAIGVASPKAKFVIDRIKTTEGVIFIYSRFIKSGALPLVLALEANGYTPVGRDSLLRDGIQVEGGRQCAFCDKKEKVHKGAGHIFSPAKYILLTGKANISPNNGAMVAAARNEKNKLGRDVKVIVGSQVASEGIDLRFVREIYVFDSWFHLNKMEQVLGRGVRTCSHSLLPPEKRNTTIHLLVNAFENGETETADLYMYRNALVKAQQMGNVTRVLKEYALDCNLNIDAIVIPDDDEELSLDEQNHIDAHGKSHMVSINDAPYTAICDWIENCSYECKKPVGLEEETDISTYDEFSARWHEASLKKAIRRLFEENEQPMFRLDDIEKMFSSIPRIALKSLLAEVVGNQAFRITLGRQEGYIVYRNGYYLFQPDALIDQNIPLALRVQSFPVKRDLFEPPMEVVKRTEVIQAGGSIWPAILEWSGRIRSGEDISDIPGNVQEVLKIRYTNPAELSKEIQHLFGILWLYEFMRANETWRGHLADVLLGLVWDEFLRPKEQAQLVVSEKSIGAEYYMSKGGREVFRFVDAQTGLLRYQCGAAACDVAVARVFDTDPTDPLNKLQANINTVGKIYGFLVPNLKTGFLIFKTTDKPSSVGKVPPKGGACEIITQISHTLESLVVLGNSLAEAGLPRFGLTMEDFIGPRKFQNASRACSLKNVILRWMNLMRVGGKYWFFRPVAAYKSRHQVLLEKPKTSRSKKGAAAVAAV